MKTILLLLIPFYSFALPSVSVMDYGAVGNGVHKDDTAIVNALAYLNTQGGGTLTFPAGFTYRISRSASPGEAEFVIIIPQNVNIVATGATIGLTADAAWCFRFTGSFSNMTGGLIKKGGIELLASCITISQVESDSAWGHAFHLSSDKSNLQSIIHKQYRNVTVQYCKAVNPQRHGFAMHRKNASFSGSDSIYLGEFYNIRFLKDTAIGAGQGLSPFDYGFGMENILVASSVTYDSCRSTGSQGAGFHIEFQIVLNNINYNNCYAGTNGVSHNNGYPYGFLYRDAGVTYTNCQTENNWGGTWECIPAFKSGVVKWINSGEVGYTAVSYDGSSINNQKFITDVNANLVTNCGKIFLGGALSLPMYGVHTDLISVQSVNEIYWDTLTSAYINGTHNAAVTNTVTFDNATWVTSIASQPIKIVDTTKTYTVGVVIRTKSGTTGSPYVYVQEFNSADTLLNVAGHHYTIQNIISTVQSDTAKLFTFTFGHGTSHPFQATTQWVRVSLSEAELNTFDKKYSLTQFYCKPL